MIVTSIEKSTGLFKLKNDSMILLLKNQKKQTYNYLNPGRKNKEKYRVSKLGEVIYEL